MKKWSRMAAILIAAAVLPVLCSPADAATRTWVGSDTVWANTANWSGGSVPASGDDVVIPNLANDPVMVAGTYPPSGSFASFDLQASAVVTCGGDTGVVNAASGGTALSPHGTGITINVSGNATIAGTLDAQGQGFPVLEGPGAGSVAFEGAGYGGLGGVSALPRNSSTYGSPTQPTALGSGAFRVGGGAGGGGAIRLNVAGSLNVTGLITADSGLGSQAGGSGGSIRITAGALTGGGTITADGGNASTSSRSGGGGGRASIEYGTSTFNGTVSVARGTSGNPATQNQGQPGTLWEPKRYAGQEGSAGSPVAITIDAGFQYTFTNPATMYYWDLTLDGAYVEFHTGSLAIASLLLTNNAGLRFDSGLAGTDANSMEGLSITGSITVAGTSELVLPAEGLYDLVGALVIESNAVLYALGNSTNVNAASGGSAIDPHGIGVMINVGGDATIAGTVDAQGHGFTLPNNGPGAIAGRNGGGYGGAGGVNAIPGGGGQPYGLLDRPTALGSSGNDKDGGGAISILVAGTLDLNGTITADSQAGSANASAGSGGSIRLGADTFSGNGTITASGGNAGGGNRAAGGGGRVAVEYVTKTFNGTVSIPGGFGGTTGLNSGFTGTWFNCESPVPNVCAAGDDGVLLNSDFSAGSNNVKIARVIAEYQGSPTAIEWTDTSTDLDGVQLNNTVDYTLTGLAPTTEYNVFTNGVEMLISPIESDAGGTLVISNIVLTAAHTTRVAGGPAGKGTVVYIR